MSMSSVVIRVVVQQGSQETFHLGDYLIYPTEVFVTEWSGIIPEEAGLKEDTWPMPDGSSIVGVKIADHGRRPRHRASFPCLALSGRRLASRRRHTRTAAVCESVGKRVKRYQYMVLFLESECSHYSVPSVAIFS